MLFCITFTIEFVGNKYRTKNCKEIICVNLCNNTAEVKDANLGQQRAYIHFSYLFSCKSNEISIPVVMQTFDTRGAYWLLLH